MIDRGGRGSHGRRFLVQGAARRRMASIVGAIAVAGCVSIPTTPRALLTYDDGSVQVQATACPQAVEPALASAHADADPSRALDPSAIRLVTWNIHKQGDPGWQRDLRRFSGESDLVLLQETVLDPPLRAVMDDERMHFVMASSFIAS